MRYIWNLSKKSLISNYYVSIIIILSLFLGMLFPVMMMSGITNGIKTLKSERIKEEDNVTIAASYSLPLMGAEEIKILEETSPSIEAIALEAGHFTEVSLRGETIKLLVSGITNTYFNFFDWKLTNGTKLEANLDILQGKNCLVGEELAIKNKLKEKDQIKINNVSFEIVGIIKSVHGIYIPYQSILDTGLRSAQHSFYIRHMSNQVKENLKGHSFFSAMNLTEAKDRWEGYQDDFYHNTRIISLIVFAILLYAIVNILTIFINKLQMDKRKMGIQIMLGASPVQIYAQKFLETFVLSILASILIFLSAPVVNPIFLGFGEIEVTVLNMMLAFIVDIILSITICAGMIPYVRKSALPELLQG